ncbi:MAG: T9SS type A sorting domain-containing protein, partial [Bacteroidota bacterium]|nr:T9SS type A sorting domain-containing protein [Bacteroidota bacterium]
NPTTVINYSTAKAGHVTLKVYDLLGREISTLVDGIKGAGKYSVTFDASKLSSGIYFYDLKPDDFTSRKKMMLIR